MHVFADALTAEQRKNLKDSEFALPNKRMFPIPNKTHIKMAWDMVDRAKGLSDTERKEARNNILAAAKKADIDTSEWDKTAMTDAIIERPEVLLDSANAEQAGELPKGVIMRVRCKGTRADVINAHNRTYPKKVMLDSLEKNKGTWDPIESPHPAAFVDSNGRVKFRTNLDNMVGRPHGDPWMDSEGWVWFDADIFDTTKGRNIAALIRAGEPVGVSMRSAGHSVKKVINDSLISVATAIDIRTFDFVPDPATEGCSTTEVLLTDSQMEAIMDGLSFSDPVCPLDGTMLTPVDPDQDNDVDYWACSKCNSRYDVYNGVQVTTSSNQNIYRRWDSPQYGSDRTVAEPPGAQPTLDSQTTTNSEEASEVTLTPEQIQAMIADATARATAPFQSMLDAQQQAEQAAQNRQEAQAFLDSKFAELEGKYSAPVLAAIKKAVGEPNTKQAAEIVLDSVLDMAGQVSAGEFLSALGFTPGASAQGQTRVQVTNEPKPWQPLVDSMLAEFDRIDAEKGGKVDHELRKFNKALVDKVVDRFEKNTVLGGYQAMKDSLETVEALLDSAGASVSTTQMLNQPTIQTVILIQKFQDLVATQFMMTDVFEGSEWRIPSESFTGSETIDPATLLYDIVVNENGPIPEAVVDVVWASFTPKPRRNAISLTTDVIRAMGTGPLKYDAPARAIYHIGKEAARKIDSYAYWDMAVTADEYLPLVVSNESVSNVAAVSNGTNVAYKGQLTLGGQSGTKVTLSNGQQVQLANTGFTPIVRPRTKQVITANGSVQTVTTNAITCKVGGTTLVQGGLDSNGNIVGSGAQFAINFETGDIYFVTGLGITLGSTPVYPVISYSASTNYDIWSTKLGTGYTANESWYNTFVMQLTNSNAIMGASPRFNPANLALFSLQSATYVRNAEIFYKWAQPAATGITPTNNFFGTRDELDLYKLNTPWVLGDNRILLTQKGSTRYGIQTPYKIEGPIQKLDPSTGQVIAAKAWYGEEFSCICTPQVIDANGNVINPVSRTIKIVNY